MTARRIFISADPGVDDMAAILYALADPGIATLGVGAVWGNVPKAEALENADVILGLAGRAGEVPLYPGSDGPLIAERVYGKHRAVGRFSERLSLVAPGLQSDEHAASALAREIRAAAVADTPITIVSTSPMTDVALAISLAGRASARKGIAEIAIMGGAFRALGNRAPHAEMNMLADPHAARMVLEVGLSVALFPLDVTHTVRLTDNDLDRVSQIAPRSGAAFASLFRASDRQNPALYGGPGGPVHDLLPMAWLTESSFFEMEDAPIRVVTSPDLLGHTARSAESDTVRHRIAVAVDADGLRSAFFDRLAMLETIDATNDRERMA